MTETINLKEDTESKYAGKLTSIYEANKQAKTSFERQLYINVNFIENHHFLSFKQVSRTIDRVSTYRGVRLRSIPKTARQGEAITNMMTGTPIVPSVSSPPGEEDYSQEISQWLQQYTYDNKLKTLFAEWVYTAFHQTYAVLEIAFDEEENEIYVSLWDAFDILLPPNISSLKEAPYLFKLVPKRVMEVKESEVYNGKDNPYRKNLKDIQADNLWSPSEMKNLLWTERFGQTPGGEKETDIVTLKECYLKEKQKDGRTKIRIVTLANDKIIFSQLTDYEKFPFVLLKLKPGHIYKPAWIQSFISTNRSMDMIVSHLENFAKLFWIGRIFKRRGERVDRLTNEPGATYEYSGVQAPEIKDMPNVPPGLFNYILFLERWIEEQGVGTRPSSSLPSAVRAAKMMESMKRTDYENLGTANLYYSAALEGLYEKIIECGRLNYDKLKDVNFSTGEKKNSFKMIGEDYYEGSLEEEQKPVLLRKGNKVKIDLEPAFAYTAEGRRLTLTELIKIGLPLQEVLLKELKVSNIGDVLQRMKMEKKASLIDAPDFQILPDEIKRVILSYLKTPQAQGQNPLAFIPEKEKEVIG